VRRIPVSRVFWMRCGVTADEVARNRDPTVDEGNWPATHPHRVLGQQRFEVVVLHDRADAWAVADRLVYRA
jgi:hypothetical protein